VGTAWSVVPAKWKKPAAKPRAPPFIEPEFSFAGCLAVLFVDIGAINETAARAR
jgi:hypothetical protein